MAKEIQVLTGDVLDKEPTSSVEEIQPETASSPKEIYATVEKELPVLNAGDKVWRIHNGELQKGRINSAIPDGTFGNVIVEGGPDDGWGGNISIEDGSLSNGWQFGAPPVEQLTGPTSEGVDQELLARHLAMKMSDEDAVQQPETQPNPEAEKEPWNKTSRSALRQIIDDYNEKVSPDQRIMLEDLEKETLTNLQEVSPVNSKLETMSQLSEDEANQLQRYLEKLRVAATRKGLGGEDNPEVKAYFENDLKDKRSKLAELTYKRINSAMRMRLPKNRKMLNEAQDEYDESLRALGRWELAGIEGTDEQDQEARQIQATELALSEMRQLRSEINSIQEPERARTSKKRRNIGRAGLVVTSATLGMSARIIAGVGTLGATTAIGAGVGIVTGAAVAGYRAQRDLKYGLDKKTNDESLQSEVEALSASINGGQELDEALKSYLQSETTKAGKERRIKIAKRVGWGALKGFGFGAAGAVAGYGIVSGVEWLGDAISGNDAAATADAPTYDSKADVAPVHAEPQEVTAPSTEDLLQQYAGDNADAALNIETGEGPYQTLQELGIPEEKWDDLFNNDELMQKLVENGDAYSLQDAGVQEHGWGWTGNELSQATAGDLYDAAGMNTPDAIGLAESGLPPTYAELTPGAQEFAMNHSVVTDIPNGMGGEELMKELGVDQNAWAQIESDLVRNAPNDFATIDGQIGLSHSGALSAGGVEELLKSLNQHGYTV